MYFIGAVDIDKSCQNLLEDRDNEKGAVTLNNRILPFQKAIDVSRFMEIVIQIDVTHLHIDEVKRFALI